MRDNVDARQGTVEGQGGHGSDAGERADGCAGIGAKEVFFLCSLFSTEPRHFEGHLADTSRVFVPYCIAALTFFLLQNSLCKSRKRAGFRVREQRSLAEE
jgi:hypothetical protein